MKTLTTSILIDSFHAFKTNLGFINNFIANLLDCPVRIKYAAELGSFSVMHFDTTKDNLTDEYVTVAQLSERYPAFSQGSIRWLIFNGETNGFKKVVRKIGRKVILNLRQFQNFLEEKAQ